MNKIMGSKIRTLRLNMGLTQGQLAGTDITRSMLSQIENGKCNPSLDTLKIIAERLNKYPEYFLTETDYSESCIQLVSDIENLHDQGKIKEAENLALKALELSKICSESEIQALVNLWAGRILRKNNKLDLSYDLLELALNYSKDLADKKLLLDCLLELGHCCCLMEEFKHAKRYYQKALTQSEGLKRFIDLRVTAQIYLGTCMLRIGQIEDALTTYSEALNHSFILNNIKLTIEAGIGVAWVSYKLNRFDVALETSNKIETISRQSNKYMLTEILHNKGIYLYDSGNKELAYTIWKNCLEAYHLKNDFLKQVSVNEEISKYWIDKNDLDKANVILKNALSLLNNQDNTLLRGRIYRKLGEIQCLDGNYTRGIELYEVGYELHKKINAHEETSETLNRIAEAQNKYLTAEINKKGLNNKTM